jgi:hypothetical protein
MIRPRALEPSGDLCCLPSPYRIPRCVAGMAFNFSKVEVSQHPPRRNRPAQVETSPRSAVSATSISRRRAIA